MRKKDDLVIEVIYLSRYTIGGSLVAKFARDLILFFLKINIV